MTDPSSSTTSAKPEDGEPYDLDTSALAALDTFRAQKAAGEASLLKFSQSSSSSSRKKKTKRPKEERKLTPEEEAAEEAKAEAALLAEIEAIADLERLNGVAPDSADSMLAALSSRLEVDDVDNDEEKSLDVDTFRQTFGESWQLSQFWYSAKFVHELSQLIFRLVSPPSTDILTDSQAVKAAFGDARVAFLCCPTAWVGFVHEYPSLRSQAFVFEVDKRFHALSKTSFVYYNLHEPEAVPKELLGTFDVLVSDPPFLNADTQGKVAQTARLLAKDNAKFLLCTGDSIAEEARKMYGSPPLEKLELEVEHHGLANAFGIWGRV
ncbi:DNA methylase, N-6 adenine-specific, eukaryotic [Kalmanozyma brasiliensis GHG001]|uniref:Protein-lysine N-methyltransferase EFM5 n=1 Tax=Kalmanozyma brasiliensis (strain GHG001) TaxID=1365824 RepID=V5EBU3_KALBG|nr:DNA methylase, N-6 adenine-specific, eukaryotic [Kalmanozyma brasiliensis GHG001]EST07901.1 DNA methylase, N-6 adenine-specific, eukaryotic [Kalmanozyma brasiliensis GHG001]